MKKRNNFSSLLILLHALGLGIRVFFNDENLVWLFLSAAGFLSGIEIILILIRFDKLNHAEFLSGKNNA